MLLLIDNYDSFVYNLARYFVEIGCETLVVRNDAIDVAGVRILAPQAIVISPGPRTPDEAGVSTELISQLSETVPMLGVCLGHQAIATAFGGRVIRAKEPVHGRTSFVEHTGQNLFADLPSPLRVARYHSLIVDETTLSNQLLVTARTTDGIPMALQHRSRPLYGVQFHPESVLTHHGRRLLSNFTRMAGIDSRESLVTDWAEPEPPAEEQPMPIFSW